MARPPVAARVCGGVTLVALLLATSGLSRGADVISSSLANEARCAGSADPGRNPRGGYVDYLHLFYCVLGGGRRPALGYAAMAAWLAVLFYLLADTAAVYFCSSLEGLARLLGLPPAIAGATLLSLGNGAPDALSALASLDGGKGGGAAAVGLNGVLGGAMFVSAAVLGVVALRVGGQGIAVDRASFFRDAGFLLLALAAVAVVLAAGEVNIWGAVAFASLYLVYVLAVAFTPDRWTRRQDEEEDHAHAAAYSELHSVAETKFYTDQEAQDSLLSDTAPLLQYYAAGDNNGGAGENKSAFWTVMRVLALPLILPRRLTIPDASKERWSKPTAVTAATLAPIFLSILWSHRATGNPFPAILLGGLAGLAQGLLAFLTTDPSAPPARFLAAWLAGGFAMSVAWAYVIANEVLSLLVSAGTVLSVDAATLGVTVLAWGNSLGDLIANVAVASRGGPGGAQVAVAGCYGGPVFNVLVGLGLSMLLSCWTGYPQPVKIPREPGLYRTLGFVVAGLSWALVMLPRRGMRVDRTVGFGLLAIYFCFVCINISQLKNER
ncbi:cation/calcium exchanger 1-like [Panicum miliaceum]|uniref:Cation/calcium exchanger 1-like n=1 Tax=Panicum miliaceum TaxID=4540 RepID=A0A3L6TN49_PANMI|nr:cation/calcium exchanger 1-like [Panicum miliaceum]